MDKGLHAAFRHLTEALQHTRDKDIVSIIPCADLFHVDTMVYMKEDKLEKLTQDEIISIFSFTIIGAGM